MKVDRSGLDGADKNSPYACRNIIVQLMYQEKHGIAALVLTHFFHHLHYPNIVPRC